MWSFTYCVYEDFYYGLYPIFIGCPQWPPNTDSYRHWRVVWSSLGSTTAMLCSTALQATASRSCSECRTTQLRSFSRLQDDPKLARCWGRYTGCLFNRGSSTKWLCWHSKSAAPLRRVPATPNPGSRTRPQPAIDHYGAVSTFRDNNICKMRFSMLCTSCLELTTENRSQ